MQPTVNLSQKALDALPDHYSTPSYNRDDVRTGVVHFGPGNFFRAHQAVYFDNLLNQGDLRWGISAVSLRSKNLRDALAEQDNYYTLVERAKEGENIRVVGSIKEVLVAHEDPNLVLKRLRDPDTKIVTLCVTQNGYYYNNQTKTLDFDHPDIVSCMEEESDPVSAVGFIVTALKERMDAGMPPFTVMSCDNIPGNGNVLRQVVEAYATSISQELYEWISDNVEFPVTMVDRITPRTTAEHIDTLSQQHGIDDAWPVFTETFTQWVIEDTFCNEKPDLESVGAELTDNVAPYELTKIRILNGSHMALGPIGHLSGHDYAHQAMNQPEINTFINGFIDTVITTLPKDAGIDFDDYKSSIIDRLVNPYMKDELTRLARNGSQKVPSRLMQPAREAVAVDGNADYLAFAVAAWIEYAKGYDSKGAEFDINDVEGINMGLQELARQSGANPRPLFALRKIFGHELSSHKGFTNKVEQYLRDIVDNGMTTALSHFNEEQLDPSTENEISSGVDLKQTFSPT